MVNGSDGKRRVVRGNWSLKMVGRQWLWVAFDNGRLPLAVVGGWRGRVLACVDMWQPTMVSDGVC